MEYIIVLSIAMHSDFHFSVTIVVIFDCVSSMGE